MRMDMHSTSLCVLVGKSEYKHDFAYKKTTQDLFKWTVTVGN